MGKRLIIVGGSGYLGSELVYVAKQAGYETIGTYNSNIKKIHVRFNLHDQTSWDNILELKPDALVWAAQKYTADLGLFKEFVGLLSGTKLVYISSDVTLCQKYLAATGTLAEYARQKTSEQAIIEEQTNSLIFVVGPIYGKNSSHVLDGRSAQLLELRDEPRAYWDNVCKTFVPVKSLAQIAIHNLDKKGVFFIGPKKRQSYYSFYKMRTKALGTPTNLVTKTSASQKTLYEQAICKDTSFAQQKNRLWTNNLP